METPTLPESAGVCGQSSDSADNLRTEITVQFIPVKPAPDYGEPWHEQEPPHPISVRAGVYWLNPRQFNRAVSCVNACAGMSDPAAEIQVMRLQMDQAEAMIGLYKHERYELAAAMRRRDKSLPTIAEIRDRIRRLHSENDAMRAELADIRQQLKGHPDSKLDGENGLAAATMRGFDGFQSENEDMREAINAAHAALTNVSPVFGRTPAQDAALAKLQPFTSK